MHKIFSQINNKRANKEIFFLFTLLGCLFFLITDIKADERVIPFKPGEKMEFQVKWSFIPAGTAVLEVLPIEKLDGENVFHFVFTARTSEFVDLIYKVRDRIESYAKVDLSHAVLYKKQKKGKTEKEVTVTFDWKNNKVQYSNLGERMDPVSILPGTFDPLSVFFYFRLHELDKNIEIKVPVTDGKKCITSVARVIGKEKIEVGNKSYDTYLVEPELEYIGGVFQKSKNAKLQIWVTADSRRIPVRIKSRVLVGSFIAELVSFIDGFHD